MFYSILIDCEDFLDIFVIYRIINFIKSPQCFVGATDSVGSSLAIYSSDGERYKEPELSGFDRWAQNVTNIQLRYATHSNRGTIFLISTTSTAYSTYAPTVVTIDAVEDSTYYLRKENGEFGFVTTTTTTTYAPTTATAAILVPTVVPTDATR
ncbi:MAG: hypothetical protein LBV04_00500 [Deferribacteraceae bacterium]|nr:hypothetical protein [Deferribacteraceae bacterium]